MIEKSGGQAAQEAAGRLTQLWTRVVLFMAFIGLVMGFNLRGLLPDLKISSWACGLTAVALAFLMWGASKWAYGKLEDFIRDEPLFNSMAESKPGKRLTQEELPTVARKAAGAAPVEAGVTEKAGTRPQISAIVEKRDDRAPSPLFRPGMHQVRSRV